LRLPVAGGAPAAAIEVAATVAPAINSRLVSILSFRALLRRVILSVNIVFSKKMLQERYFEGYIPGSQRTTGGRTITETDIVTHAGQTGDFYPHHMDAEWCRTQSFKQRMAHGTLVFSVAVGMTAGEINPRAMSYGYDRLRFVKPVFIGDTIRVTVTIKEKRDDPKRPKHGIIVEACEVVNQRNETVLVCDHLLLVERRPTGA
jgi:acyl dehydratase